METFELFERLAVALAIGLLIGLERGWKYRGEAEGERAAGLRTHALSALLGGVWAALSIGSGEGGILALGVAFAVFSGGMALFIFRETQVEGTRDATNLVAAMLAFMLGAFAVRGDMAAAAAAGVASTGLLALKPVLHSWVKRLTWEELRSVLVLLAMSTMALPILPNRAIDPWGAINPFEIWVMTLLIALMSFAGYVMIKVMGENKGIVATAIAGGLVSSTAVTVNMAQLSTRFPEEAGRLSGGVMLSSATMMARVGAVVAVVNSTIAWALAPALLAASAVLGGYGLFMLAGWRGQGGGTRGSGLALDNPLDVKSVARFGVILTLIIAGAKLATAFAGDAGAYVIAVLSGIADVDAVTLSMARLGGGALSSDVATRAIAIVVAINTISKAIIAAMSGTREFGRRVASASAAALMAGAVGLLFT